MPKTWVRPYVRKNGTYVSGHIRDQRVFGAFAKVSPGYKGWIQLCLMACFTPLILFAFPVLLILLTILFIEKITDFFERKRMGSKLNESTEIMQHSGHMIGKGQKIAVSLYLELKKAENKNQNRSLIERSTRILKKFIPTKNIKHKYSANINSGTFHLYNCKWSKQTSKKNILCFDNREEALKSGLTPCRFCKP